MTAVVRDVRVSLVWVDTFPELLGEASNTPDLTHWETYRDAFTAATNPSETYRRPWPNDDNAGNQFWYNYLRQQPLGTMSAVLAWRRLVPLRAASSSVPQLSISVPNTRAWAEVYRFPLGIAAMISIRYSLAIADASTPVLDAVAAIIKACTTSSIACGASGPLTAKHLAGNLLAAQRTQQFPSCTNVVHNATPFIVASVISGDGSDPAVAMVEGSDEHRAVQGLATLSTSFKRDRLDSLKHAALEPNHDNAEGDVLYRRHRGRCIWFPRRWGDTGSRASSAYHRNLALASMQTESLVSVVRAVSEAPSAFTRNSFDGDRLVRNASLVLGLLYNGAPDVYRSESIKAQIDDSGQLEAINKVRSQFGLLTSVPPPRPSQGTSTDAQAPPATPDAATAARYIIEKTVSGRFRWAFVDNAGKALARGTKLGTYAEALAAADVARTEMRKSTSQSSNADQRGDLRG
jgi:hypothetical protein